MRGITFAIAIHVENSLDSKLKSEAYINGRYLKLLSREILRSSLRTSGETRGFELQVR